MWIVVTLWRGNEPFVQWLINDRMIILITDELLSVYWVSSPFKAIFGCVQNIQLFCMAVKGAMRILAASSG